MKNKIFLALNYLVSAGLIWWLAKSFDFRAALSGIGSADVRFILAAMVVSVLVRIMVYPSLWQNVLRSSGLVVKYTDLVTVNAASLPLKFVMPFKISEVVRAAGLRIFGQMNFALALSSTVFLRLAVLIATGIIFVGGMGLNPVRHLSADYSVGIGLIGLLLIFLYIDRLPDNFLGLGETLEKLVYCFKKTSDWQKIKLLGYSVLVQFGEIISSFLIFRGLGLEINFFQTIYYVSLVMLVSMIPISVQGIGIRETAMVMGLVGVAGAQTGLAAGLLLTLIHHILPALVGGLVWILSSGCRFFGRTVVGEVM